MTKAAVSQFDIGAGNERTGNLMPLLHQLKHALDRLLEDGEATVVDLRSIPLGPGEEDKILGILGQGEVTAHLEILGPSEIFETRYAGVWIVTHYNADTEVIGRYIEITYVPDILRSRAEDMAAARSRLAASLEDVKKDG